MTIKPTSDQAREAVNVFTSIDVLGLLDHRGYDPYQPDLTIEELIQKYYLELPTTTDAHRQLAQGVRLQTWDDEKQQYLYEGIWDTIIKEAQKENKNQYKEFNRTYEGEEILGMYVRLIANRGDTQGWKLEVKDGDIVTDEHDNKYLTQAYNLSIKAKPEQWIRWWGNSITPFSAIQCVVERITTAGRPQDLPQLDHQQSMTISYQFPSGNIQASPPEYTTAQSYAFSRLGQLKPGGKEKIQYDIRFNMVDLQGDIIAAFKVDPEIMVVSA